MADQIQNENKAVVGEDGELIQADATVNPDAYAEYVATHVRRDPLLFRMRENIRENGCIYLFVTLAFGCMACGFIQSALAGQENIISLIMLILIVAVAVMLGYGILQTDTRQ